MNDTKSHDTKFWIGFFVGGLLGAVLLYILGTKEGKKTAKDFKEKSDDILDIMYDKLKDLEEKGQELVDKGAEIKQEIVQEIEEKKEHLTSDTTQKLDDTLAHIEAIQERGRETTASLRKRLFKNLPKK